MDRMLRVVVVDDSAYVRKVVKQMLSRSSLLEVVGTARDGDEALEIVDRLKPDVVTCDLIMQGMGGVEFIRKQMALQPIPIVVVSIASESGEQVLNALDAGAIDFVQKPTANNRCSVSNSFVCRSSTRSLGFSNMPSRSYSAVP